MKILKHGNPDIIKDYTTLFTCNRCGCEFTANSSDLTEALADGVDAVTAFAKLLGDVEHPEKVTELYVYKTHCPDCGQELSKTKAEIVAEDQENDSDKNKEETDNENKNI